MLPKPATFVLEPGDRFFHQLLVVSVIKIHPLGLQLFQGHGCPTGVLITAECAASADSTAGFLPAPARPSCPGLLAPPAARLRVYTARNPQLLRAGRLLGNLLNVNLISAARAGQAVMNQSSRWEVGAGAAYIYHRDYRWLLIKAGS